MARMSKKILEDYRCRFLKASNSHEMEQLRDSFYTIKMNENTLDNYWEQIATGELLRKKKYKKLELEDIGIITDEFKNGKSKAQLAKEHEVSKDTIRKYLKLILNEERGAINV